MVYHPEYFRKYLAKLKGDVSIIVKKRRKNRSLGHNKFWHGVICQIVGEWMGETTDDACKAIKKALGRPYYWEEKDKFGSDKDCYWSTAEMTGPELNELVESTRRLLAPFKVELPEKERVGVDN